jgi:hypothetical protein
VSSDAPATLSEDGWVAQPFGFRPHGSQRAALPHYSALPKDVAKSSNETLPHMRKPA